MRNSLNKKKYRKQCQACGAYMMKTKYKICDYNMGRLSQCRNCGEFKYDRLVA